MHTNTTLFNSYLKSKTPQFFNKKSITVSPFVFNKNNKITLNSKQKGKLTAIRKSISASKVSRSVIEWKSASNVIKKLNWENKYLFGPVQSSKQATYDSKKIEESNLIIQHKTQIPIFEPFVEQNISITSNLKTHKFLDFEALLSFPLLNKSVISNHNLKSKINEWNILRTKLECLSKNFSIPSVSTILEKTMPSERIEILNRWKQNMIKQLGVEGFQKYQRDLLANGASLHSYINSYLTSTSESELLMKKENIGHWNSLKQIVPYITDVKLLEEFIMHPFLCYRGVVDCFARYKNHLVVIDWKTSKKSKMNIKNTYDNPLQIAAYVGALNFDPKYQYLANNGLIAIAYESGSPATAHFIDENTMLQYWNEWLQRLKQFWEMKSSEIESI